MHSSFVVKASLQKLMQLDTTVEGGYIEYGNIEKCCGWLNRNHSDGNIEFNFENSNIDSKTGSNGVIASPIIISSHPPPPTPPTGDPMWPPVWPRFTVNVTVFEVKFDVTAFDVTVVEVDVNFFRCNFLFPEFDSWNWASEIWWNRSVCLSPYIGSLAFKINLLISIFFLRKLTCQNCIETIKWPIVNPTKEISS